MNRELKQAEQALCAALAAVKEFESPLLSATDRVALDEIARRVAERLAALSAQERRLALQ